MITVQNLHKKFAANTVLNGVDVQIEKGQSMAIIVVQVQENQYY